MEMAMRDKEAAVRIMATAVQRSKRSGQKADDGMVDICGGQGEERPRQDKPGGTAIVSIGKNQRGGEDGRRGGGATVTYD